MRVLAVLIFAISLISVQEIFAKECKYYKVRRGDSWWKIAKREGISIKKLRKANPRIGKYLKIGQRICIPVKKKKAKKYKKKYTLMFTTESKGETPFLR